MNTDLLVVGSGFFGLTIADRAARELGLRVPQDISVIGFDDIHLCRVMNPPITTVRQPLEQLMRSAVSLLIGRMEGKKATDPENITMVPELMVRGSTGPAPTGGKG